MWFLSPVFMSGRSFAKVKYGENNGEVTGESMCVSLHKICSNQELKNLWKLVYVHVQISIFPRLYI